jgi:hypothetical protein
VTKVCLDFPAQALWFKPSVLCAYRLCKLASKQSTSIVDDSELLGALYCLLASEWHEMRLNFRSDGYQKSIDETGRGTK